MKVKNIFFQKAFYHRNVLSELFIQDKNIIAPWGVEFADSSSFYSLEGGYGYRYKLLEQFESVDHFSHKVVQIIKMKEGLVRLELEEWLENPTNFRRICKIIFIEDTFLMDFVLRYRFLVSRFQKGYIANNTLRIGSSHIYHQYPVERSKVENSKYSIVISVNKKNIPSSMKGYMYLQYHGNYWVLHVRMLPLVWEKEVIKLCSKWFKTSPLPSWLSMPLLKIPNLKEALWYRGEKNPYKNRIARIFSPNAYPMVKLKKGELLLWDVSCRIENP